jgi:ferredoxin
VYTNIYLFKEDFKMARIISDSCISCGSCADTCPVSAIAAGDNKYVVDADTCIDCGACEDACPVSAISAE